MEGAAMIEAIRLWLYKSKARQMKRDAEVDKLWRNNLALHYKLTAANARLSRIAELETPRCAHVGRKMARIARGEA
jgi:hypothetical protein